MNGNRIKILVVGAAGKSGRAVVEQAVHAGIEVTAFVHDTELSETPGARVVRGDATVSGDIDAAIIGQDAVLDLIGGKTPWKTDPLESTIAGNIVESMKRHGVRRLIVTSTVGEGDSEANTPIYERVLFSTLLRGTRENKAAMESAVRSSDLDWIIVRPAILTDGAATGNVRIVESETGEKAHSISRADLASFMLAQLSNTENVHRAVSISNN